MPGYAVNGGIIRKAPGFCSYIMDVEGPGTAQILLWLIRRIDVDR